MDTGQLDVAGGWYAPSELKALCVAKLRHPSAAIVAGGTAVGLQLNGWRGSKDGAGRKAAAAAAPSHLLSTASIPELHGCEVVTTGADGITLLAGEFDESPAGERVPSILTPLCSTVTLFDSVFTPFLTCQVTPAAACCTYRTAGR